MQLMEYTRKVAHALKIDSTIVKHESLGSWRHPLTHE
jgi:hypothetical protein